MTATAAFSGIAAAAAAEKDEKWRIR